MQYPDGATVLVGDLIWWNEGTKQGRVALIIDSEEKKVQWGLLEFGIFISPSESRELVPAVFYPADCFEDEGIGKVERRS